METFLSATGVDVHKPVRDLKYWATLAAIRRVMRDCPDPVVMDALFQEPRAEKVKPPAGPVGRPRRDAT